MSRLPPLARSFFVVLAAANLLACFGRMNPVVVRRAGADEVITGGDGQASADAVGDDAGDGFTLAELTVVPVYPLNADWNDYVRHAEPTRDALHQADTACLGDEAGGPEVCIHGGDKRKAVFTRLSSCAGVVATDALDAFAWSCDTQTGAVEILSTGLQPGKGLRDLLDANGFRANSLRVEVDGQLVGESAAQVWGWTNSVVPLPANPTGAVALLDQESAIYVTTGVHDTTGLNLNADRVALVTLGDSELAYSGNGTTYNCSTTTGETASPNRICLVAAGNQRFLWLEVRATHYDPPAAHLVYLAGVHFCRVQSTTLFANRLGNSALWLVNNATGNLLSDLRIDRSNGAAIELDTASDNTIARAHIVEPWSAGVALANADRNLLQAIRVEGAGHVGITLDPGNRNRLIGLRLGNSGAYGLQLIDSSFNIVHDVVTFNTRLVEAWEGEGIRVYAQSHHNVLTRILSANNGSTGLFVAANADTNTVSHATVANGGGTALALGDVKEITAVQILAPNSQDAGLSAYGAADNRDNTFANLYLAHGSGTAISLQYAQRHRYTGHLWTGNNGGRCWVDTNGSQPGLVTSTCSDTGLEGSNTYAGQLSDAVFHVDRDLSQSFIGKIAGDDPINGSDAAGQRTFGAITDWTGFANGLRTWGRSGSPFPHDDHRGCCVSGETCAIWDWRLRADDTAVRNVHGAFVPGAACPAAAHGDQALTDALRWPFYAGINAVEVLGDSIGDDDGVCEVGDVCQNRFLIDALELLDDGRGDEDGLCESDEACIYSPNVGAYQGEGALSSQPCLFTDGAVTNVTLYGYTINGG